MIKTSKAVYIIFLCIFSLMVAFQNQKNSDIKRGEIKDISVGLQTEEQRESGNSTFNLYDTPHYSGTPSYVINNNHPEFTEDEYEKAKEIYIYLPELDYLGRCGQADASLGTDTLADGERQSLSSVYPSGWRQAFYPDLIGKNDGALYNRFHLIMYAMSGIQADPRCLITGTEYMNNRGMLPYETAVQNWIIKKSNGGRVLYRVTPVFVDNELVARGVHMEAADVESRGEKFHINVFCYNVQPGIVIDYKTGLSKEER